MLWANPELTDSGQRLITLWADLHRIIKLHVWSQSGGCLFTKDGALSVGKFFITAMVTTFVNEFLGGGEVVLRGFPRVRLLAKEKASAVEVDVGQEEFHGAALGNFPCFIQIRLRALGAGARAGEKPQPGAGEEAKREICFEARAPEAGHTNGE